MKYSILLFDSLNGYHLKRLIQLSRYITQDAIKTLLLFYTLQNLLLQLNFHRSVILLYCTTSASLERGLLAGHVLVIMLPLL